MAAFVVRGCTDNAADVHEAIQTVVKNTLNKPRGARAVSAAGAPPELFSGMTVRRNQNDERWLGSTALVDARNHGVLVIDDYSEASIGTRNAILCMIETRHVGDIDLHGTCFIIVSGRKPDLATQEVATEIPWAAMEKVVAGEARQGMSL
jgi:hypothetical protein